LNGLASSFAKIRTRAWRYRLESFETMRLNGGYMS